MKAIQMLEPKKPIITELPMPILTDGNAIVKIKSVGICGTDVTTYNGNNVNVKSYPIIIGHETAGEIYEIDTNNEYGLKKGDKVILDPYVYCGHCYPCKKGKTNCCEILKCLGVHCEGSMSEYFAHPTKLLRKVPQDMDWKLIPLAEPLVIGMHGLHTCELKSEEHIVIIGAGAIGLLAAMGALAYNAIPIIVDVVEERLNKAKEIGVKYVINPLTQNAEEEIKKITNGNKAECVMEASGNPIAVRNALDYAASTGKIALTGWPKKEVTLPTSIITRKELQIRGSRNGAGEFEEAIELIYSGKVPVEKIITEVVPFDKIPEMLKALAEHPEDYLKIVGIIE